MKSLARPRGPLPSRVYWLRRTLLLVVVLGMVFGVGRLLGGGDPSDDTAQVVGADAGPSEPAQAPVSTADARPRSQGDTTPGASPGKATGKGQRGRAEKTPTPLAQPTGPCRGDDVVVKPKVLGNAHAGTMVHFRLKLKTQTSPACTWTVSSESVVVKITSGEDRIWSSQDCPAAVPSADVVVRKDVPAKVEMGWRGQRSDSTCSRQPAWAMPGFYHVEAAAYGAEPTDVQFELMSAVAPTRTAKPKPDKDEKGKSEKAQNENAQGENDKKNDGGGRGEDR